MPVDLAKPLPTSARLSLGRTAAAISTHDHLQFQLDHALARDAVHAPLDVAALSSGLQARNLQPILLRSAVEPNPSDRRAYLRRPDLGRKLHSDSITTLQTSVILSEDSRNASPREAQSKDPEAARSTPTSAHLSANEPPRILFILSDGLSALAIERHALPLLDATLPLIPNPAVVPADRSSSVGWCSLIPLVQNARVAIADEIGHLLHADLTVLLIGERPGLSSADSLGVYITWNPQPGRTTDAERNCISNIRGHEGLSYAEAANRIAHYIAEATRLHTTGITLKDPAQTLKLGSQ
jgi:ethanolamine ammonia-lyase small subunit